MCEGTAEIREADQFYDKYTLRRRGVTSLGIKGGDLQQ